MHVNARTARQDRVRRFERSTLLELGIFQTFSKIFKFSVLRRRALWLRCTHVLKFTGTERKYEPQASIPHRVWLGSSHGPWC
jgi:hypothetical protein